MATSTGREYRRAHRVAPPSWREREGDHHVPRDSWISHFRRDRHCIDCRLRTESQHDAAADEAAVAAVAANWEKAYNEKNADAVAAIYCEDAQLLPPGPPAVTGRAAIRDFWANDIATGNMTFAITAEASGVDGDWAWRSGPWKATAADGSPGGTGKMSRSGTGPRKDGRCTATSGMSTRLRRRRPQKPLQPILIVRTFAALARAAAFRELRTSTPAGKVRPCSNR